MNSETTPPSRFRKMARAFLLIASVSAVAVSASAVRQGLFAAAGLYLVVLALFASMSGGTLLAIVRSRSSADGTLGRIAAATIIVATALFAYGLAASYAVFPLQLKEAATRGHLNAIQSALSVFIEDHNGASPQSLLELIPGYLPAIPSAYTREHGEIFETKLVSAENLTAGDVPDSGSWGYVVSGPCSGTVFVDCTHNDTHGLAWLAAAQRSCLDERSSRALPPSTKDIAQ